MSFLSAISHRGNLRGRKPELENTPGYIDKAIDELYEVEVDIRFVEGCFYLGHDKPEHFVDLHWIKERNDYLIFHCKNLPALYLLKDQHHCFWHDTDTYTLTSKGKIWTYPNCHAGPDCILVDLEPPTAEKVKEWRSKNIYSICSDYADVICSDFPTSKIELTQL
jgi:hypothetical protein